MKSLNVLIQPLLEDLGSRCDTSTDQDLKTILARVEHEGWSFLTITLPSFGKDFEKALSLGRVTDNHFAGFRKNQQNGGLPRFLGGFLRLVFNDLGWLLEHPSQDAIFAVRQLTLMFGKVALPCSPERERKAYDGYIKCEQEVRQAQASMDPEEMGRFARIGRLLWADLFARVDNRIYADGVLPKHGPGATADRLSGNRKYNCQLWTTRLEAAFPHWEYLIPSVRYLDSIASVTLLEPDAELPVRVVSVPKTLKTPRIIAIEPTAMQYMQQGILELLVQEIRDNDNARNFVQFETQEHNRALAKESSFSGTLATLDLSEASDRVSNEHVRTLLANHRFLREAVDATRSRKAHVPGHGVVSLAKFASMGSALCFPFEALVFTTVLFSGIERALNRPMTIEDIKSFYGRVRVYGDDIIVPTEYVDFVIQELETFGFRVNLDKSFREGKFRESCGAEFYNGRDVSITRLRRLLPENRSNVEEVESAVAFRNHMFHRGMERTVALLDRTLKRIIPFPAVEWRLETSTVIPTILQSSPLLGRHDYGPCQPDGHDSNYHHPFVRGVAVVQVLPNNSLEGPGALVKWFLKRGCDPFADRNHLQRSGRPVAARIINRKASPLYYGEAAAL